MYKSKEDLFNYFKKNSNDKNDLLINIKKYGIDNILNEKLKNLSKEKFLASFISMNWQKIFNEVIKSESKKLIESTKKSEIKLIFLKGLFLAADLYQPIEMRLFGDIDLLVDTKNLNTFLNILGQLGYVDEDFECVTSKKVNKYWQTHHLIPFRKEVKFNNKKYEVKVEVHIQPFHSRLDYKKMKIQEIDNLSVRQRLLDIDVLLLEHNVRLMHLLKHFTRHYVDDYFILFSEGRGNPFLLIRGLHDIVLFINKYADVIDWEVILNKSIEWDICVDMLFPIKILNDIYGEVVPLCFVENLENSMKRGIILEKRLLPLLVKEKTETLIFNYSDEFARDIYTKVRDEGCKIECPNKNSKNTINKRGYFEINEYSTKKYNKFGTYLRLGEKPLSSKEFSSKGRFTWDEFSLIFYIRVYNEDINYDYDPGNRVILHIESNEYSVDKVYPKRWELHMLPFTVLDELQVVIENSNMERQNHLIDSKYSIYEDGYEVEIIIPWKYLNLKPYKGMKLWFDIRIKDYDSVNKQLRTELSLANIGSFIDPTLFASMELV